MANNNLMTSYQELVGSYQAIDTFRSQLLARLPLATGSGIFLLYATKDTLNDSTQAFLPAIGLFGLVVALGLFVYEIYGIMKCTALIKAGQEMESLLGIEGQFLRRPASFLNEPFAAALIYPAVLAAWAYVSLAFVNGGSLLWIAPLIFGIFFIGMAGYNFRLLSNSTMARLNEEILRAEEEGNRAPLEHFLHPCFIIVRSNGDKQDKEQFLNSVVMNKNLGRASTSGNIHTTGQYSLYTGIVTTAHNQNGTPNLGYFRNTRLFVKENGQWTCLFWQVTQIP
ncbi:MAG TPA: nuclear transport factor 2 family protein [Anaerolineales bacterium]|nr:nuclear transport factor 2 family protein [Anaerolineales bacterium]